MRRCTNGSVRTETELDRFVQKVSIVFMTPEAGVMEVVLHRGRKPCIVVQCVGCPCRGDGPEWNEVSDGRCNRQQYPPWSIEGGVMSDYRFRPFEDSRDRGVVLGFLVETLRIGTTEPVDIEANEAAYFAAVERTQARDRRFCSMLLEGDAAVGFVDVFTMPKKPGCGFMRFCYVVPERRGCGVSDRIIDYCVELMSEYGCSEILLDVRAGNPRAVAFYARHGWVVREEREDGYLRMGRAMEAIDSTDPGGEPGDAPSHEEPMI